MGERDETARSHVDLARDLMGQLNGAAPRGAAELLDPEVEIETDRALPGAGRFHGQPGFLRWLERWSVVWAPGTLRIEMVEPVGERHAVASVRQRQRQGGELAVSYLLEFRSGRPIRMHAYASRRAALDAARVAELG